MAVNDLPERILEAAAQVLRERGPRVRLISNIAERAGVSRPTLYRHFPHRSDIYDSLVRRELETVIDELVLHANVTGDPRDEYLDTVAALVRTSREHPALRAVLASHPEIVVAYLPRLLPIVLDVAVPRVTPVLKAGAEQGAWPDISPRIAVLWTTRLVTSLITMPLPEDTSELGLRTTISELIDVANSIASAPRPTR